MTTAGVVRALRRVQRAVAGAVLGAFGILRCGRCGALLLPADVDRHWWWHVDRDG